MTFRIGSISVLTNPLDQALTLPGTASNTIMLITTRQINAMRRPHSPPFPANPIPLRLPKPSCFPICVTPLKIIFR